MEYHTVYLERNYKGTALTKDRATMALNEFTNKIDPYTNYRIVHAIDSKKSHI